jgi:type I restriction enzyme S subunit
MPVVIPKLELIQQFDRVVNKITIKITSNNQQIQSLIKTRDTLLPKLMSGQVRVNNLKQTANA